MEKAVFVCISTARWGRTEELGIGYISSILQQHKYDVKVLFVQSDLDEQDLNQLTRYLSTNSVGLVGLSCSHSAIDVSVYKTIVSTVRNATPTTHITCGGYWASFNTDYALTAIPELDSVVVGEGEFTVLEMMRTIERGAALDKCLGLRTRLNKLISRPPVVDLDCLPNPDRGTDHRKPSDIVSISTSRGCLARCTFCNVPKWMALHGGKKWRGRSATKVVEEITQLHHEKGCTRFWVVDSSYEDPFPTGVDRIQQIANGLINEKLRIAYYVFFRAESLADNRLEGILPTLSKSGLRRAFVGVEAGNDGDLRRFGKRARIDDIKQALNNLRAHDIVPRAGFIMFSPSSNPDQLTENMNFLDSMGLLYSTVDLFGRLELYTGAAEVARTQRIGLLKGLPENNSYCYRFLHSGVAKAAEAMSLVLSSSQLDRRWEALHTAKLIASAARNDERVQANAELLENLTTFSSSIDELCAFLSKTNREFFLEVVDLIKSKWDEQSFSRLVDHYIDGYQVEVATTSDALASEFLLRTKKADLSLVF